VWAICSGSSPSGVPKEVSYYYLCKEFKCLPGAGGLLDQDPVLVEAFTLCMNTEGLYEDFKQKKEEAQRNLDAKKKNHGRS
jgi:hypothetical protein